MIDIRLDIMLAKRRIKLKDLSVLTGLTKANLSIIKRNKSKAIRFSTLEKLCEILDCQPADLLTYVEDK